MIVVGQMTGLNFFAGVNQKCCVGPQAHRILDKWLRYDDLFTK